jgi:hypothetical protein
LDNPDYIPPERIVLSPPRRSAGAWLLGGLLMWLVLAALVFAGVALSFLIARIGHGRPLRLDGRVYRGRVRLRGLRQTRHRRRPIVAARWAFDAALEHASVGAFLHLAERLRAVEAPQALVRGAQRAAEEERGHTQACLDLAQRYGGAVFELDALPRLPRVAAPPDPASLLRELLCIARESELDGCRGEGRSARVAWKRAAAARDPHVKAVLCRIAAEETGHAVLAREIVEWCASAAKQVSPSGRDERVGSHRLAGGSRSVAHVSLTTPPTPRQPR